MFFTYQEFRDCVQTSVRRFATQWLNARQDSSVSADPFPPIFIVAGPGTGKTTVLALRVLKLIFVDGFNPNGIMATTFTRKAANELRSRILSWGYATLQEATRRMVSLNNQQRLDWLNSLDINGVITGTLDSIAEDMIAEDRHPGEIPPVIIEKFMAEGLMRRNTMYAHGRHTNQDLESHLCTINPQFPSARSFTDKLSICHSFADRVLHDGIDLVAYSTKGHGEQVLAGIVNDYHDYLQANHIMDFALLEKTLLTRLQQNRLSSITQNLRAVLVDEFQDTNYLQEQIYYEFCRRTNASFTVVGDDDQSVYRFRGATVEIFANFANRVVSNLGPSWSPTRVDLIENYRSSERIVKLCNHFITADPDFQTARAPGKQSFIAAAPWAQNPTHNLPVFGLFRDNLNTLASDICLLLLEIFRGNGKSISIDNGRSNFIIERGPNGDFGDAVLLSGKVGEENASGNPRLPLLLRQQLLTHNVHTFNPRGRNLSSIQEIAQCLGLMLECIDPQGMVQASITSIRPQTRAQLNQWRTTAQQFMNTNPAPGNIRQFVADWGSRTPRNMGQWPNDWPILELLFAIITWIPFFQNNPEGQVYLEVIARTISVAGKVSPYKAKVIKGSSPHDRQSIAHAIREIFEPIAEGHVDVDEEIMPFVPRNYFPIMTVHQAKGLEFPLVIVDVGSDYRTNHAAQRRFRFPDNGDNVHHTEDDIANFTPVGSTRLLRASRQRAFDDLRRLYYVAKSRAENVLILAGLTTQIRVQNPISTVAIGDILGGNRSYNFVSAINWTHNSPDNHIALI